MTNTAQQVTPQPKSVPDKQKTDKADANKYQITEYHTSLFIGSALKSLLFLFNFEEKILGKKEKVILYNFIRIS